MERLLSKPSWDPPDATSDLHILMTFEKPKMRESEWMTDGSSITVYDFRILEFTWVTFTDPSGKAESKFGRSR